MTEIAVAAARPAPAAATWERPDARRVLQLALAAVWLLDGVLQFQAFMYTKGFSDMLAGTAEGNPGLVASPITWNADLVRHHLAATNTIFAAIQVLIGIGIAWRPTVRVSLAASVLWSLGVWWFAEGLGMLATGTASPLTGAPGAVLIYAMLAILLWPADREPAARLVVARFTGTATARAIWVVFWGGLAYLTVQPGSVTAQGMHDTIAGMTDGEPGWLVSTLNAMASLVANQGVLASWILAIAFAVIAAGVLAPPAIAKATIVLAIAVSALIWVAQALGGMLTGGGTDPNSGLLLAFLAIAYWPGLGAAAAPAADPAATRG